MDRYSLNEGLRDAAKAGNLEKVRDYLAKGADINYGNWYKGDTPLHLAVNGGNLDIVQLLLERADIDPNKADKYDGTPLQAAAKGGYNNIVKLLLERTDIDPNKENKYNGDTPLHFAASGGNLDIVQLLLERADIDPNRENKAGDTLLHSAARDGHLNILQLLLERTTIDPNRENKIKGDTPLHTAVRDQNLNMVQLLLERRDLDPNTVDTIKGDTPLHTAVRDQNLNMVHLLLERRDIDPNKVDTMKGDTPLHTAVRDRNLNMVQLLLERRDLDPNTVDMNGDTPLYSAVRVKHLDIVQLLLERTDIDPNKDNQSSYTPLHYAVINGHPDIVHLLLGRPDIDPNKVMEINGDTPLHSAARDLNLDMVKLLLERGDIDPDKINKRNKTPIDVFEAQDLRTEEDNKTKRAIQELIKCYGLGLPAEIRGFDKGSAKVFTHLLEEESYPHFESRVMLAGEQGTGKTTIARYLIGKGPTRIRKSTDGIGLYTGLSYIDRETEEWLEGKQDFSLEELTISRSLRQKPFDIPTRSLSTGLSTDLNKQFNESLMAGASVRLNKQQVVFKEKNEMQGVPVEAEKDNIRSREQGNWNNPTQRIADDRPITNVLLDQHKQQGDPNDERPVSNVHLSPVKMRDHPPDEIQVQNVHLDLQKHQDHPLDENPLQNVPLDLDKTKCDSKDERLLPCVLFDLHKQQGDQKRLVPNVSLDLIKQPNDPQDKKHGPKVLLDIDKQQVLPLDEKRIPKVLQDDVPQHRDSYNSRSMASNPVSSSNQPNYSDEDTQCEELVDKTYFQNPTENESQEYKPNPGSHLVLGGTMNSRFPKVLSIHALDEQMKTLTQLSEEEQATSGLTHSVASVTNPGLITKLKRFFRVSKEVKEIKVSITEEHILKQSLKVGKKKLHQRHIAPVIIWDFGGQDIFYSTHQSFLSYRAIYLIVLDGSRALDDPCQFEQYLPGKSGSKTARDYLRFWINTIVTYCKGSQHGFPKIMIVFTHKDKLKPIEVETTRELLFGEVKNMFYGSPLMSHLVIEDKIFVNARNKNDPEMATIRRVIIRESKLQPTWGQNFPKCFIPLELEFENLIRENMNVITFDDLRKINTQHPIRPLSDAELKVFLKFQHAIGKILYFDEPGLDTHITLLPTYLIDAFKSIITDKRFCKGEKQREHLWNLMSQKGVISKCAIEKLWRNGKYRRFEQHKDYLEAVMTHLDILVEPKRYDLKRNRIPTDFYFVASMVQAKDDTGYLQSTFLTDRNIAIAFSSNSATIPPALSFRFITYCLSIFDVKKYGDRKDDMLFHRSAVFTIDPSLDIHILCEDERIFIRLVHAKKKVLILKDLALSICDCLKSALQNISQLYIKTSSDNSELSVGTFEMSLCCSVAEDPCLLSIEEFNKIDTIWICPGHKLDHEKFVLSSWITEKEIMMKCEINCPVTNEDFLSEDLSALQLRRLSILYNIDEIRELVTHLELPYTEWKDLFIVEPEPQLLKFKALCLCHEQSTLTFRKIKKAVEEGKIQNPHTLCKVMRGAFVDFDTDPEKWDLVPSDEDIDKMAPLIGNKSLFFLVELGMNLETWDTINHRQTKRDLVKLNKDILDEWMLICKAKNVRPTMRMIAQAYTSIGKDIRVLENTLFN